ESFVRYGDGEGRHARPDIIELHPLPRPLSHQPFVEAHGGNEGRRGVGRGDGIEPAGDTQFILPDARPDREHRDEWRARDAGQDERPDAERRWSAEELDLRRALRGAPRIDLQADDLISAEGLEEGGRAEDGAAGIDDVETVTRAKPVHELARGGVRLRRNDQVHRSTEVGKKACADLRPAEVSGGHYEPSVLRQRPL